MSGMKKQSQNREDYYDFNNSLLLQSETSVQVNKGRIERLEKHQIEPKYLQKAFDLLDGCAL